ncbi:MAG: hypothetical protein WCA20_29820, partial [Candidatus Sulfotelmatobacter sp.]
MTHAAASILNSISNITRTVTRRLFHLIVSAAFFLAATATTSPAQTLATLADFDDANGLGAQQPTSVAEATMEHPDWVHVPGELIRPDCVHEIPNGARVSVGNDDQITGDVTLNGVLIAHYDPCSENPVITRPQGRTAKLANPPGTGNGWVEDSEWNVPLSSSDNIDYMAGSWTVPERPLSNGALIYLFNGIEPSTKNWILQPVLQYGVSPAGGGNYWAIASWLVGSNGYAYHSPLYTVQPGHSILGYTKLTATSGKYLYWYVVAQDKTTGEGSWIQAESWGLHWTWAFAGVLEADNVTSCTQFPSGSDGSVVFTKSVVDHDYPSYKGISPQQWNRG